MRDAWRKGVLLWVAAIGMVCGFVPTGRAQAPAATGPNGAVVETAPAKPPDWDVVSVKPTQHCTAGSGMQILQDGVHVFCLPLRALIQIAWGINEPSRVLGMPAWAGDGTYDIDAKVASEDVAIFSKQSVAQRNQMLQALLQDRFQLKAHLDRRELPVYDLVVAKGGPKLKEATPDEEAKSMLWLRNRGEIDATSMPLHSLPSMLTRELDRPVVDKTGLTGKYDFVLQFTPGDGSGPGLAGPFRSLRRSRQLGLKLHSRAKPH